MSVYHYQRLFIRDGGDDATVRVRAAAASPRTRRQEAAQQLAGDDFTVLSAGEYERLKLQAAGEYGLADIQRAKADALHAFANTMDRLPGDWILVRRDYGSEVTVEDLLRQTADRYVEQPYPILTQIRVDPKQPDRPEPVDPASIQVGQVVEIEHAEWALRGEVAEVDDSEPHMRLAIPLPGVRRPIWPDLTGATVRILQRPEPEPDEAAVEALARALYSEMRQRNRMAVNWPELAADQHKHFCDKARNLIRDHGVRQEVPSDG